MKPYWEQDENKIYHGHAPDVLRSIDSESVQMCVTSPPYWGLRDYDLPPMVWDAQEGCTHKWGDESFKKQGPQSDHDKGTRGLEPNRAGAAFEASQGQFCQLCNAWRGCLGLEPTPELYIKHMVEIFAELKRVLRSDGCLFLNLGDTYGTGTRADRRPGNKNFGEATAKAQGIPRHGGMAKQLMMMPARTALALQADGWWLRSAMPWVKRSAMPESVTDRPASALEHMFLLTKSSKYYFDLDAIKKEPQRTAAVGWKEKDLDKYSCDDRLEKQGTYKDWRKYCPTDTVTSRNFRNTDLFFESLKEPYGMIFAGDEMVGIDCNPQAMKEAHFATFPEKLIEPCILAGTSERGACVSCSAPWYRIVEKRVPKLRDVKSEYPGNHSIATRKYKDTRKTQKMPDGWDTGTGGHGTIHRNGREQGESGKPVTESKTIGWKPSCECTAGTTPCSVLDIFGGAMTTAIVAHKHGRKFVMIELSKTYIDEIGIPRIEKATKQKGWNRFK